MEEKGGYDSPQARVSKVCIEPIQEGNGKGSVHKSSVKTVTVLAHYVKDCDELSCTVGVISFGSLLNSSPAGLLHQSVRHGKRQRSGRGQEEREARRGKGECVGVCL